MQADLNALASLLRDARAALGLTLREVEARCKVSNAYLSQLEGAKIKQPSPQLLHTLCELYGCSYSAALEFAGHPLPTSARLSTHARFAARLGKTTPVEEEALLDYLKFLRSKNR
ncbi:MAG TPA: helix-turn-helix transcriptional regulator [Terrimicrobium sp.]